MVRITAITKYMYMCTTAYTAITSSTKSLISLLSQSTCITTITAGTSITTITAGTSITTITAGTAITAIPARPALTVLCSCICGLFSVQSCHFCSVVVSALSLSPHHCTKSTCTCSQVGYSYIAGCNSLCPRPSLQGTAFLWWVKGHT